MLLTPIELLQGVFPVLALPLAVFLPHYLRYKFQARVIRKDIERLNIGKPLSVAHSKVLEQRVFALSQDTISTKVSRDRSGQLDKINQDFTTRLYRMYAAPYPVWEKRTLIPPALHVAWTAINLWGLHAGPAISVPGFELFHPLLDNIAVHAVGCLLGAGMASTLLEGNLFWRSFDPHYVRQMRPELRRALGLNDAVVDKDTGLLMPHWFSRLSSDVIDLDSIEKMTLQDAKAANLADASSSQKKIAKLSFFLGAFTVAWWVSFSQTLYLFAAFFASTAKDTSIRLHNRRVNHKVNEINSNWLPLSPRFGKS